MITSNFAAYRKKKESDDEISVQSLKDMFDKKEDFILVDVREKFEWDICNIDGAKLIPLSQIKQGNTGELEHINKDKSIVLHCKSGKRSMDTLEILRNKGYKKLKSVSGGISAWAEEIDTSMPTY